METDSDIVIHLRPLTCHHKPERERGRDRSDMAYIAISFLMENLSQLLKSKIDLISGAEKELQLLTYDLRCLRAAAGEAENKPEEEELEKLLFMMKSVVCDAEYTIDSCLTMAAATAEASNKSWRRRSLNTKPVNLAGEVRSLINRVKPLFEHFARMPNDIVRSDTRLEEWQQPTLKLQHQVGFDDEVQQLINIIMEDTEELDIIYILGMLGMGTSALLQKVFENKKIQYEFPTRIRVKASRDLNRKDVYLHILKQLSSQDMSSLSDFELATIVHKLLGEREFLLAIDDVWSVEDWDCIREVLPKTNGMSKVLITSSNRNVSGFAREPFVLRLLTVDQSSELLQLLVFGNQGYCPYELEGLVRGIAMQCNGIQLVLTVVGGILWGIWSKRKSISTIKNEWMKALKNLNLDIYLRRNKYELGLSVIISMSYSALPHDLRDCFLYLGVIPQDYEISAWTLTRLWIAEGFIQSKDGWSLEETAENNLIQLSNRNLVIVCKINSIGQVKTCRVDPELRRFCNSEARFTEQNLFKEIKMSEHGTFNPPCSNLQEYRRLCIHSHLTEFLTTNINGPRVRSLLWFYNNVFILHPEYISAIPNAFKLLRVLASKSIKFTKFPLKFTRLIHLRYLTVSCDDLDVLPETLSRLWNLQTLVVETESPFLEVRANIWKMIQLRHFKTTAAITLAVQGEGSDACENLQTLSRLSPEFCTKQLLDRVPNLKTLGIRGQLTTLIHNKCLQNLDGLTSLKLVNDLFYESTCGNRLAGLPSLPPHLKRLSLSATYLDWEHMSILGKISTLEVLKLKNNAFTGQNWRFNDQGFQHLKYLLIAETDLVIWEVSADSFPRLGCLVLKNCEQLQEIPVGLSKSLEQLEIERLNRHAVASAKKIKKEKRKTQRLVTFNLSIGIGCE